MSFCHILQAAWHSQINQCRTMNELLSYTCRTMNELLSYTCRTMNELLSYTSGSMTLTNQQNPTTQQQFKIKQQQIYLYWWTLITFTKQHAVILFKDETWNSMHISAVQPCVVNLVWYLDVKKALGMKSCFIHGCVVIWE